MMDDKKSFIMNELLELMKNSRLNNSQKIQIINLVEQEKTATKKQKERFMLFYGLNKNGEKDMNFTQISKIYNCNIAAIRSSVFAMKCKLLKYEEKFSIIEDIVNECKKEMLMYAKQNKSCSC